MSKKLLYLSLVSLVPSEKGEAKIKFALEAEQSEEGYDAEFYDNLGIRPPKDIRDKDAPKIDENGNIHLEPDELEYEFSDCIILLSEFSSAVEHEELGSVIYTKSGNVFHVEESPEEIFGYILIISRTRWEKFRDYVSSLWRKITTKENLN